MLHHQAGGAGEVEDDAHEAVDGDLGHHAAHQGRDMARRRRMRERQPDMQRHEPGLGAGAEQRENEDKRAGKPGRGMGCADRVERVAAIGPGEQAEGEQQRERAEARHDQVDVARANVAALAMMRHDQRPRGERHELPGGQEGEGIVGEDNKVHAGQEGWIERQHTQRRRLVLSAAKRKQAGGGGTEIDDGEKESRKRVHTKINAEPRQAERQRHGRRNCWRMDERAERSS